MGLSKRLDPRIPVETLCSEVIDEREHYGVLVELSPAGVRLERPYRASYGGGRDGRIVQLEFELPDADEIIWAKGEVCFDRYRPGEGVGAVRSTGVRLVAAASRHLRMLREWVVATVEAQRRARQDDIAGMLALASHWRGRLPPGGDRLGRRRPRRARTRAARARRSRRSPTSAPGAHTRRSRATIAHTAAGARRRRTRASARPIGDIPYARAERRSSSSPNVAR